jgi:tetraacyldisaccharide 4'-kinase
MLRRLGADLAYERAFPDHHPFGDGEIAGLRQTAARENARLVTTHKDWVRLRPEQRADVDILQVEIGWRDEPALTALLAPILQGCRADAAPGPADGG